MVAIMAKAPPFRSELGRHPHEPQVNGPGVMMPSADSAMEAAKALARLLGRQLAHELLLPSASQPMPDGATVAITNTGQSAPPEAGSASPAHSASYPLDNSLPLESKMRPHQP